MKSRHLPLVLLLAIAPLHAESVSYDPYEGYNRVMFGINDTLDRNIITPVARGYRAVTPSPVRAGIGNFFNNLRDVLSAGHNLLRLDITKAGTDLVRVGINTTFGFGGLINIADAAGMPNNKTTLGDTFASWGWQNSNYFVYPLLGPSTVRDAVGNTISLAYPIENAVFKTDAGQWTAHGIKTLDTRASLLTISDGVEEAAIDRYAYVRDAFMAARARQLGQAAPQDSADDYVPSFEENSEQRPPEANEADVPNAVETDNAVQPSSLFTHHPSVADEPSVRDLPPNTIHVSTITQHVQP